jgi:hypothetical protein
MIETIRYFSDHANQQTLPTAQTCFGRLLTANGITAATVERLMANPPLTLGDRRAPAFDLLEEIQPHEAIERIKKASF